MTEHNNSTANSSSGSIDRFLNKKIRLIRKSNRFIYIGFLKTHDSDGIVLEDRVLGDTFIPASDIGEITEYKEDYRNRQTGYVD